ncbi:hypothetical protein MLD38_038930 [Melastoma candidum]|uniref:Uncharacterized protein n=1 Tax=Melastoma candidum TaxID=119954 RepID=A0ACB9L0G9_9MYRT|nr:hypothetical protein MLD38_038930 [Melastoma candidum]
MAPGSPDLTAAASFRARTTVSSKAQHATSPRLGVIGCYAFSARTTFPDEACGAITGRSHLSTNGGVRMIVSSGVTSKSCRKSRCSVQDYGILHRRDIDLEKTVLADEPIYLGRGDKDVACTQAAPVDEVTLNSPLSIYNLCYETSSLPVPRQSAFNPPTGPAAQFHTPHMAVLFEGIQSATAFRMTDPRIRCPVRVPGPSGCGILSSSFNVVLYYGTASEGPDSGRHTSGWIKESLSRAFAERPLLCGRLRMVEDGYGDGDGEFEVVSNDSGARLIDARIDAKLDEFLGSEGRDDCETALVYWKDIDVEFPQFSPLLYVQVTNFQCGGYSIGVSCSLIVADVAEIIGFIERWATIHVGLQSLHPQDNPQKPIFRLSDVKRTDSSKLPTPSLCRKHARTIAFSTEDAKSVSLGALVSACTKEADKEPGTKLGTAYSVMVKDATTTGTMSVSISKGISDEGEHVGSIRKADWGSWFGDGVTFEAENEARAISCWVGSKDGFVAVTRSGGGNVNVLVSIP